MKASKPYRIVSHALIGARGPAFFVAICGASWLSACGDSTAQNAGGSGGATSVSGAQAGTPTGNATGSTSTTGASGSNATGTGGGASGTPMFVAVGYGGRRMSSPDGIQWGHDVVVDPNGGDDDNLFRGVGYVASTASGSFVAVGGSAKGQNATTPNGQDWTFHDPGTSWLADIAVLNGTLVTAGGNGLRERSLDGGQTWSDATDYYAGHFRGIASSGSLAIAAGHTYGNSMSGLSSTTTDGQTWTPMVVGGSPFGAIAFGAGIFVASGDSRCSTSTDGQVWADCGGVSGSGLDGVVFVNQQFVIGNAAGYYTSPDGMVWQHVDGEHHAVAAYGLGLYVGLDWPDKIYTSPDLTTWTVRQQNTGPAFVQVAFGTVTQ